jgi:hypothetical protein
MKYLKKIFEGNEDEIKKTQIELDSHRKEADGKVKEFFGEFEEEFDKVENPKELMVVFKKLIKARGIVKVFSYVKNLISDNKKESRIEKKIAELKGEKWEEDKDMSLLNDLFSNPMNLTKLINGDISSVDIEYSKKDGGTAEGEIKSTEIKDDGSIEVTIDNDKVGEIKKDLTELMPNDDVNDSEDDLPKKLAEVQTKRPDDIKKVSNFIDFISNDINKENSDKIYKIMGI